MSNRIKRITLVPVRVPIAIERVNCPAFAHETLNRKPNGDWGGPYFGSVPFIVIQIEGDGGPAGIGDTPRIVEPQVLRALAPGLIGRSADEIDARHSLVEANWHRVPVPTGAEAWPAYNLAYYKGLDTALLDWAARQRDMPFWGHFGPQVRTRVRCEFWSGFRTPRGAADVAARARELGFLGLKLKGNLDIDVPGIVRAVLEAAGPDFKLNIDPNGRWETLEQSLARIEPAVKINPNVCFEDPVYDSPQTIAELRRRTGCRTAITVRSADMVRQIVELDAADVFNCMGLWSTIPATANAADAAGKPCWLGSALESSIGDAASIHLASTLPNCTVGSDLISALVREDDLITTPIRYEGGHAAVPAGPGLGVELDHEAVERYRCGDPIVIE